MILLISMDLLNQREIFRMITRAEVVQVPIMFWQKHRTEAELIMQIFLHLLMQKFQ